MDRQRVVHYARSRTAKVIRPALSSYPTSSDSSELSQAPLASIDSDFVIITKRRDETNMAPNLWSQINQNRPQTNVILQNMGENSEIFDRDDNYSEQNDNSTPRTYVKLRASQNSHLHNAYEKSHSLAPQCLPQGQFGNNNHNVPSVASSCSRQSSTQVYSTQSTYHTQTTSRAGFTYHADDSSVQQPINGTDSHTPRGFSNGINGYTHESTKYVAESVTFKESVIANSKVKSQVRVQDIPQTTVISECSSLNPQSCLSSFVKPGHRVAQISNRIDSPSNVNIALKVSSKGVTNVDRSRMNNCLHSGFSEGNLTHHKTESFAMSKVGNKCSARPLDKMLAVDCCREGEEMLQEVCGISPSDYTSDIRLASERIAHMYTKHIPQSTPSPRNCSVYIKDSPRSSVPNINIDVKSEHDRPYFQSEVIRHVNTINQNSRRQDDMNDERRRTAQTIHSDSVLHPECNPSWKRSSLKQATHGYLSISELTGSMENLATETCQLHKSINTSYSSEGLEAPNRMHSVNVTHSRCSDVEETGEFREECRNVKYGNTPKEDTKFTSLLDLNRTQPPNDDLGSNGFKRMAFKLATSDSAYEYLNENDSREFTDPSKKKCTHIHKTSSLTTDTSRRCIQVEHLTNTVSRGAYVTDDTDVSDKSQKPVSVLDTFDHEEKLRTLKRRSFKLATSSLSDLTFLDDSIVSEFSVERQNVRTFGDLESTYFSGESVNSSVLCTADVRHLRVRDDSFSSGRLNSSFGSFYSCQSRDLQHSLDAPVASRKHQFKYSQNQKQFSPALEHPICRDSVGSDSNFSADSSAYYTASDNSYPTPDGDPGTTPYVNLLHQSYRTTMPAQRQKSFTNRYQKMTQSKTSLNSVSLKTNTLPQNVKPPRYYSQTGVLRCYGCGVNDKLSVQTQHRGRKPNTRVGSHRSRVWVNPDYIHGKPLDYRKRSRSAPASRRVPTRQSEASIRKLIPLKPQMYTESSMPISDVTYSISAPGPGPCVTTCIDPIWHAMPRIPPSLGRPRRKLYAGFDSQPLPMDNFLSDSSSVYSTQSCSSWGTSRCATVESCSRTPDVLSKSRSTSSIASSLITPTRPVTHDDVFDFFTYTDKRSSVCENSHNLYVSRENSYADDCYKEVFYDMTYSKESLESFLSDGTAVNADRDCSPEYSLDYEKTRLNSFSGSADLHKNNNRTVSGDQKQNQHKDQLDLANNRSNTEMLSSASFENRKNQLKTLKGSASDGTRKPKFLSKRKYFSTKDIFDLVMTSDKNYKDTKGRSRSLERQAQKVCETILCLT